MLALFAPAKSLVSMGLELKAGEYGYIIVRNRRNQVAVLDYFHATADGIYRTHSITLEDDRDFAIVFGLVFKEPIMAFNRLERLMFLQYAVSLEDLLEIASDEGTQEVKLVRSTTCAVLTGYRSIDNRDIINKY